MIGDQIKAATLLGACPRLVGGRGGDVNFMPTYTRVANKAVSILQATRAGISLAPRAGGKGTIQLWTTFPIQPPA